MFAGMYVARSRWALQGVRQHFAACCAGCEYRSRALPVGWQGLCLAARHQAGAGDGPVRIALGGLTRRCLHSTVPGQADAGELAAATALPPAWEAAACGGAGVPDRALWAARSRGCSSQPGACDTVLPSLR